MQVFRPSCTLNHDDSALTRQLALTRPNLAAILDPGKSGSSSVVECFLAKEDVAGSTPVSRSKSVLSAVHFSHNSAGQKQLSPAEARYPSGKGEVCKTFMRRFDPDPRLQNFLFRIKAIPDPDRNNAVVRRRDAPLVPSPQNVVDGDALRSTKLAIVEVRIVDSSRLSSSIGVPLNHLLVLAARLDRDRGKCKERPPTGRPQINISLRVF